MERFEELRVDGRWICGPCDGHFSFRAGLRASSDCEGGFGEECG